MTTNIIKAILNLVESPVTDILQTSDGRNRMNNQGKSLEKYIIDLFCGTLNITNEEQRNEIQSKLFSYLGNQNNPPDAIIRGGDAIEIKKIEITKAAIALNSSYPKARLFSSSPMITPACRQCEEWDEKDMIYAVGSINKNDQLVTLCFIYGCDYAASQNIYERIKSKIKQGILSIDGVEFAETKELGRVNKVDPLGITNLRIRGMWHIDNPLNVFNYIYKPDSQSKFNFMALINEGKYSTFCDIDRKKLENLENTLPNLVIRNVKIKVPDNPSQLRDAKLITFTI